MGLFKKAAMAFVATSMVAAPVAASAAPAFNGARSTSTVEGRNQLLEGGGWFAVVAVLAVMVGAIVIALDDDDDKPVSP